MATVTVKLFQVSQSPVAILNGSKSEQFTSSATSQQTTDAAPGAAGTVAFARVHSSGGAVRIAAGDNPTAAGTNRDHALVADGETFDCEIKAGEKIALIDSA